MVNDDGTFVSSNGSDFTAVKQLSFMQEKGMNNLQLQCAIKGLLDKQNLFVSNNYIHPINNVEKGMLKHILEFIFK